MDKVIYALLGGRAIDFPEIRLIEINRLLVAMMDDIAGIASAFAKPRDIIFWSTYWNNLILMTRSAYFKICLAFVLFCRKIQNKTI